MPVEESEESTSEEVQLLFILNDFGKVPINMKGTPMHN